MLSMRHMASRALLALLGLGLTGFVLAAPVGTVTQLAGVLTARQSDQAPRILAVQSSVNRGEVLTTAANTYARLRFTDGGELTLRPNTQIRIDDYRFEQDKPQEDNAIFTLLKGGLRAVTGLVGKRNGVASYRMSTPTATIGIRGTNYGALYCNADCGDYRAADGMQPADGLHVDVADGRIVVSNEAGSRTFGAGEFGFVGGPKVAPINVPPGSGVRVEVPGNAERRETGTSPTSGGSFECVIE
jgi:hypothetical protein